MCSQKSWNLIRRLISFSIFFSSFFFLSCNKEDMLMNRWNLQSVKVNGSPIDSVQMQYHLLPKYTYYYFFLETSLNVETIVNGQYTSANGMYKFVNKSTLYMHFMLHDKKSEITAKIKKLTRRELNLQYDENGNTYFLKLYSN